MMEPRTRKLGLLVGLALAGLTGGCFGNCGGCVGDKLGDSFEALGEAMEKDVQADVEDDLQAEANRELALAEGREPAGPKSSALVSQLPQADLSGLGAATLASRLGAKGYERVGCDELEEADQGISVVGCQFRGKGVRLQAGLLRVEQDDLLEEAAAGLIDDRHCVVRDGMHLLSFQAANEKQAEGLLAKLARPQMPSARAARVALEQLGYRVGACEREDEDDSTSTSCTFSKEAASGIAIWMELGDVEGLEDGGPVEWDDELAVSRVRGKVITTLTLLDREAARRAARSLFPELKGYSGGLLITVDMDPSKPSGKAWDALGGEPDPYIKVNGRSYRDERCEDTLECAFVVPRADSLKIQVVDADGASDDPAGSTVCRPGVVCMTDGASVEVIDLW